MTARGALDTMDVDGENVQGQEMQEPEQRTGGGGDLQQIFTDSQQRKAAA